MATSSGVDSSERASSIAVALATEAEAEASEEEAVESATLVLSTLNESVFLTTDSVALAT